MNTYVKINYDKELSFEERDSLGDWYSVYEIDSPFRTPDSDDKIILCLDDDKQYSTLIDIIEQVESNDNHKNVWFGFEQEYYIYAKDSSKTSEFDHLRIHKDNGVGSYFCSAANRVLGRAHIGVPHINVDPKNMCGFVAQQLDVQVIEGKINEVLLKTNTIEHIGNTFEAAANQFEFIVGPYLTLDAIAKLSLARYLSYKIAEENEYKIYFDPKPFLMKNTSGLHTNFSNITTRSVDYYQLENEEGEVGKFASNYFEMLKQEFSKRHKDYMNIAGDNRLRMSNASCTSNYKKFSFYGPHSNPDGEIGMGGVKNYSMMIKDGHDKLKQTAGLYVEDRRPASNANPYLVAEQILTTMLGVS